METSLRPQRNTACPCGSGKKYKNCCAQRVVAGQPERRNSGMWAGLAVLGLALAAGAAWKFGGSEPTPNSPSAPIRPPTLNVSSGGQPIGVQPLAAGGLTPPPPGSAPPGKVWSAEHGHWHDVETMTTTVNAGGSPAAAPSAAPGQLVPEPPGGTPPGKVWSPEHGHYHDAPGVAPSAPGAAPVPVPVPIPAPVTPGS